MECDPKRTDGGQAESTPITFSSDAGNQELSIVTYFSAGQTSRPIAGRHIPPCFPRQRYLCYNGLQVTQGCRQ